MSNDDQDSEPGPFRPERPKIAEPALPEDVEPDLPRAVHRELRQHIRARDLGDRVAVAMTLAVEAIREDQPGRAVPYLEWAKRIAPRAPVIRETLGIARYRAGEYRPALNELRAYRRFSNAHDQDHLIADCLRALERGRSEVAITVKELLDSGAPADRKVEGVIVWAGAVADDGNLDRARAILRRADEAMLDDAGEVAHQRWTFVRSDLAARDGDRGTALEGFRQLAELPDDPYDLVGRIEELEAERGVSPPG